MNKDQFLALGVKTHKVNIESINSEVFIKEMSYAAAIAVNQCKSVYERAVVTLIHCLCDENGKTLFTMDDLNQVSETMSYYTIQEIAGAVADISVVTDSDLVK